MGRQPRVPKGRPGGGQFARVADPDLVAANLTLASDCHQPTTLQPVHRMSHFSPIDPSVKNAPDWELDASRLYRQPDRPTEKPHGLWLSFPEDADSSWTEWCVANDYGEDAYEQYDLMIDTSNLLVLVHRSEMPEHYLEVPEIVAVFGYEPPFDTPCPRWDRIAHDYSGVAFPNYSKEKDGPYRYSWWNSVDLASACVWDMKAVRNVEPQGTLRLDRPLRPYD